MSIVNDCMVVNLQIGAWKAQRLDKEATREVTERAGAEADAARVNKHLVPKDAMNPINTAASSIRMLFYTKTLPWKDNGDRLLTRSMYMPFIQEFERKVQQFNDAVDEFAYKTYPSARAQAEFRMGDLFDPEDYPSSDEVKRKFYVHMEIDAVTTKDDFRVAMDQDHLDRIKDDMEHALQSRMQKAMLDVWQRLATTLGHFAAKMGSDEIFRDSTVTNLEELVELLPDLNLLNDPQLEQIRLDIKSKLIGYDPKQLRKDDLIRSTAATEAQKIMEDMKGFMEAFGAK